MCSQRSNNIVLCNINKHYCLHLYFFLGIQPIYNELKLVLIGSHDVGKNSIGKEIFRKKVFSSWKVLQHVDIEVTRTVSGRRIHLTRTPGWKEDLNNPQKTKSKILQCVQSLYDTKPDAVLLALKVESDLSESTVNTLEDFLSVQLWSHTIVIFTHGEKLAGSAIERYIRYKNLQPLIDKCGQRYFVLEKNDEQIIETIEDFIVSKDSAGCFKPNNQTNGDDTLQILRDLVERIRSKIASISGFKEKFRRHSRKNARKQNNDYKIRLEKKDAEIKRLNKILKEKEKEITRLESLSTRLSTQSPEKTAELEKTIDLLNKELSKSYSKNEELTKQIKMLQEQVPITHERENAHVSYCSRLAQDAKPVNSRKQTATPQHELTSNSKCENSAYLIFENINICTDLLISNT